MDGATFTAVVSGAVAVVTATISVGLTYLLTKKREREADWRKLTLENYKAFTAALSGILEGRNISKEALSRFMDAPNALNLVASPRTLSVLYAFLSECLYKGSTATRQRNNELLSDLMHSMRRDISPSFPGSDECPDIRFITDHPNPSASS